MSHDSEIPSILETFDPIGRVLAPLDAHFDPFVAIGGRSNYFDGMCRVPRPTNIELQICPRFCAGPLPVTLVGPSPSPPRPPHSSFSYAGIFSIGMSNRFALAWCTSPSGVWVCDFGVVFQETERSDWHCVERLELLRSGSRSRNGVIWPGGFHSPDFRIAACSPDGQVQVGAATDGSVMAWGMGDLWSSDVSQTLALGSAFVCELGLQRVPRGRRIVIGPRQVGVLRERKSGEYRIVFSTRWYRSGLGMIRIGPVLNPLIPCEPLGACPSSSGPITVDEDHQLVFVSDKRTGSGKTSQHILGVSVDGNDTSAKASVLLSIPQESVERMAYDQNVLAVVLRGHGRRRWGRGARNARLYDIRQPGKAMNVLERVHTGTVRQVVFRGVSSGRPIWATASDDGTVKVFCGSKLLFGRNSMGLNQTVLPIGFNEDEMVAYDDNERFEYLIELRFGAEICGDSLFVRIGGFSVFL